MDYSYEDLQNLQAQSIDFKLQHCINMIATLSLEDQK